MTPTQVNRLLEKTTEIQQLFSVAQRAVPFMEEVFYFLSEITPLMQEIDYSLRDTTSKMPRATTQLRSVSHANELATTEILDLVDKVLERLVVLETALAQTSTDESDLQETDRILLAALENRLAATDPELFASVRERMERAHELRQAQSAVRSSSLNLTAGIRSRMNEIMMSLQVQDITSQQIAAVNHLIESVRNRMAHLSERIFPDGGEMEVRPAQEVEALPFNPNASFDPSDDRQALADEIINAMASGDGGGALEVRPSSPACEPALPASSDEADAGPASQAEIDALFKSGFGF